VTTTSLRPHFGHHVIAPYYNGKEATLVHTDSEVGLKHCYDVRIGVNLDPASAGFAMSAEDDPVVLVVVHAMVPADEWEHTARLLGSLHKRHAKPCGLTRDGATAWQTDLYMSQMPWGRS
jgi:hypothetical protein